MDWILAAGLPPGLPPGLPSGLSLESARQREEHAPESPEDLRERLLTERERAEGAASADQL